MTEQLRISRIVSLEMDGVPPRTISLECETSAGARVALKLDAVLAVQLEASLLRVPLPARQGTEIERAALTAIG